MKDYKVRIDEALEHINKEYPALIKTAIDSEEGRRILVNVLHRESNVDKVTMINYLNETTDIHYELRHK